MARVGTNRIRCVPVDGRERTFIEYVPAVNDDEQSLPVVVMLHGAGGTGRRVMRQTGWTRLADSMGFIALFPEALRDDEAKRPHFFTNPQVWADGSGRTHAERHGVDDVAFLAAMLDDVATRYPIDASRIYLAGFSNGGSFALRAAVQMADRIAAVACVSGLYFPTPMADARTEDPGFLSPYARAPVAPEAPVALLYIVGTADPLVPLIGGEVTFPWGGTGYQPPVAETLMAWVSMLGCPPAPRRCTGEDGVNVVRYGPCRGSSEVVFYTIEGHGHAWPGARPRLPISIVGPTREVLDATHVAWSFFTRHRRLISV